MTDTTTNQIIRSMTTGVDYNIQDQQTTNIWCIWLVGSDIDYDWITHPGYKSDMKRKNEIDLMLTA